MPYFTPMRNNAGVNLRYFDPTRDNIRGKYTYFTPTQNNAGVNFAYFTPMHDNARVKLHYFDPKEKRFGVNYFTLYFPNPADSTVTYPVESPQMRK